MAHDDPLLADMRRRFICARITRMNGVDLNRFEFDYDVTWNSFFLDAELNVYSRYGGRDGGHPEERLDRDSLLQTMREVLEVHEQRTTLAAEGKVIHQPVPAVEQTPEQIPLLKQNHQGCVHCHQVREYSLLQSSHDGTFERKDLFPYPLPENLGIQFDKKHGHRVENIQPESPAAEADLRPGDVVIGANGVPVHSEYDFRWILHRTSEDAQWVRLQVERATPPGDLISSATASTATTVTLRLPADWRQTDVGWRKSLRSVPVEFGIRGYALTRSQRRESGLPEEETLAIRVVSVPPGGLGEKLGLQRKDTIVALDGQQVSRTIDEFKSDLLRLYRPGDQVRVTVQRDSEMRELQMIFPEYSTRETSVP